MSGGQEEPTKPRVHWIKTQKKTLDKSHNLCYNKYIKREGNRNQAWQWWNRNPQKKLLTNSTRCAIMSMSRGELPKTRPQQTVETETHELKPKAPKQESPLLG